MEWAEFITALGFFFLSHSIPLRPHLRARLVQGLGPRGFTIGYSILSLAALAWVIGAAGRAPFVPLWYWAPWQNTVVLGVMAGVCALLSLTLGRPNPFSFGGARAEAFDPARPGLVRVMRHPMLIALGLWAFAHMLPNGDLAHVILFGVFGSFALLGRKIIDRRKQRLMGAEWASISARMSASPLSLKCLFPGRTWLRLTLGAVLYGLLLAAHPWLFGVSPLG